ncbi:peroxisome bioproteinsis factor 10 [Coniochaeta pulveracea]|uniref:RING-type E3 ubiquitin transferase n=1 Tax=Coniochaeta pulveracea TaxID=177199 RepID=A0A420Y3I4_9PEZI|nr:peroxisome bioproteinsis factor 10 [Coniochaeta pulveracea]
MESKPSPPPLTASPYPYASAPDIIRAHQKDAYFQGVLTNQLSDLHRRLLGARSAHAWAAEARSFADALYLSLTTLVGNRTLGEEYCDLVQVVEPSRLWQGEGKDGQAATTGAPQLPTIGKRASLIGTSVLAPYIGSLLLPRLRRRLRARLQQRLATLTKQGAGPSKRSPGSRAYRIQRYLLAHLFELTSSSHIQALTLAVFYFTGAYYSLSKRLLGLRYVFTTSRPSPTPGNDRVGYEVLGVLLLVQMAVRGWLHLRAVSSTGTEAELETEAEIRERAGLVPRDVDVSLDVNSYTSNNELLGGDGGRIVVGGQRTLEEIGRTTHTPVTKGGRARYDLGGDEKTMAWIKGRQQRNCTLCLEGMKDPAATPCGHVFCWTCIGDWVREKPECPLCRREALVQHILPLRTS